MALRSVCHQGRFELSATSSHRCAPVPVTWVCHWKSKTESLHGTTDLEKIKISARKNVQFRDCGKTKKSGGCLGAEKADTPIAGGQCMVVLSGLPVGRRRGLPRARRPRPRPGWTPDRCRCAQERPLHSSFLLNTFHRISLICASLWFESQREWEKETTVFVTCPKRRQAESGSQLCQRMLPAPGVGPLADGAEWGTPGIITGRWGPHFCGGGCRWAFCCGFSCVTPRRWRLTSPPSSSPGTRRVGQFGGRHRKNSKSLTYSIFKVEKD